MHELSHKMLTIFYANKFHHKVHQIWSIIRTSYRNIVGFVAMDCPKLRVGHSQCTPADYTDDLVTFVGLGSGDAVKDLTASTLLQCLLHEIASLEEGKT